MGVKDLRVFGVLGVSGFKVFWGLHCSGMQG